VEAAACVSVVDDDALVLRSIGRLLRSAGCVVIDLSLPGASGLQVQQTLASSGDLRPVVFISGRGDIPSSVAAMKAGAVDFLVKPFDETALLAAVGSALQRDRAARAARDQHASIRRRLAALTPREREVLDRVVAGKLNKQIAADLGTSEKTVKVHRARMMRKMGVDSLAGLVRAWTAIPPTSAAAP
jgi:FixJ family two-component response regulator